MNRDDLTRCIVFGIGAFAGFASLMLPATAPGWLGYAAAGLSTACILVGFGIRDSDG